MRNKKLQKIFGNYKKDTTLRSFICAEKLKKAVLKLGQQ